MCRHLQFKSWSLVKPREGFGFELRVFVQCAECGTPLKFNVKDGFVTTQGGLVASLVCTPAGD